MANKRLIKEIGNETLRNIGERARSIYLHPSDVGVEYVNHHWGTETLIISSLASIAHGAISSPLLSGDRNPLDVALWAGFTSIPYITNFGSYLYETGKEILYHARKNVEDSKSD